MAKKKRSNKLRWDLIGLGALAVVTAGVVGLAVLVPQSAPPASDKVAAYTPSPQPTRTFLTMTGFLGDSYTAGNGSSVGTLRWTTLLTKERGWVETNTGLPGTGYATAGRVKGGVPYPSQVEKLVAAQARLVIVSGGRNDFSEGTPADVVGVGITKTYTELRKALPNARIIALSPLWDDAPAPSELATIGAEVKAAVESVGGQYVDLGQPLEGRTDLIGKDGLHPNDAGYAFLAEHINAALPKDLP